MSECISRFGEYSEHHWSFAARFTCSWCLYFDEDAAMDALETAEAELARVQAARAEDAASLVEVERLAERWQEVLVECKANDPRWILDQGVMVIDSALRELRAALGVTAPTASEAREHKPVRDRNGSDGTPAIGCTCGASTCDWPGFLEHIHAEGSLSERIAAESWHEPCPDESGYGADLNPAPAEASEVEGSGS